MVAGGVVVDMVNVYVLLVILERTKQIQEFAPVKRTKKNEEKQSLVVRGSVQEASVMEVGLKLESQHCSFIRLLTTCPMTGDDRVLANTVSARKSRGKFQATEYVLYKRKPDVKR